GRTPDASRDSPAFGVRGARSRFRARWVARKRQQAGRTPNASRGSPAHEVGGACSGFRARWVARKRQQAGRTPNASRDSQAHGVRGGSFSAGLSGNTLWQISCFWGEVHGGESAIAKYKNRALLRRPKPLGQQIFRGAGLQKNRTRNPLRLGTEACRCASCPGQRSPWFQTRSDGEWTILS